VSTVGGESTPAAAADNATRATPMDHKKKTKVAMKKYESWKNALKENHVNIKKVLLLSHEYHGFRSLFVSLFIAGCFGLISSYHFEFPADAVTQAAVMEQWQETTNSERSIWDITSLEDGGKYVTDWLAENIEESMAKGETDTILMKDQYRILAYHIVVMHNDAADLYQNRTASPDDVCESTFYEEGGLPCTKVWSYRREMKDADYAQFTTWDEDMSPEMKEQLRPNTTSTNLKDALRDLRAMSHEPDHWLTSRSRPWEDVGAKSGEQSSILEGYPYNIPKRGSSVPAYLYVYMVYDTDASAYRTAEDSSRRIIALTAMSMQFPVIEAGSFFFANPVAIFYANRISETGFYDQSWEYGRRLPIEVGTAAFICSVFGLICDGLICDHICRTFALTCADRLHVHFPSNTLSLTLLLCNHLSYWRRSCACVTSSWC
jgi:hypothetical protein